jgi:WD40 repeat protein
MGQNESGCKKGGDYIASVTHRTEELQGFKDRVFAVALSKDGSTLVSAGTDAVIVWAVATAKKQSVFRTKRGPLCCVAISSNSLIIAAGVHESSDVLLWNTSKGDLPTALKGHSDRVCCIAFTPDGERLLSGSADSTIKTWKASNGELEGTMVGHDGDVLCMSVASDNSICVSGSADHSIKVWDLIKRAHGCTLVGHSDEIRCVAISPDGLNIVSGSSDTTIRLWHRRTGQLKGELNAEQADVCCLQFSYDGQLLISGGSDGTIKVWNFARGMLLTTYSGHEDQVSALSSCPYNYSLVRLISGSWDGTIKFWSLPTPDGGPPALGAPRSSGSQRASLSPCDPSSSVSTTTTRVTNVPQQLSNQSSSSSATSTSSAPTAPQTLHKPQPTKSPPLGAAIANGNSSGGGCDSASSAQKLKPTLQLSQNPPHYHPHTSPAESKDVR